MLTLYGDFVRNREKEIGIGSLIELLGDLGLSQQAIRSGVSRMVRLGLLKTRRKGGKSYYSLTSGGINLLNEGTKRIFTRKTSHWDGSWNIVIYSVPESRRKARDRLRLELSWMGYGPLSEATWISPYNLTAEVEELVERLGIKEYVQIFTFQAKHQGCTDPRKIVSRCWDLTTIHERYANFIARFQPKLDEYLKKLQSGEECEPRTCFIERFNLIHEYRRLPYLDPDLPVELLPENWLRPQAVAIFERYYNALKQKADEYFENVCKRYDEASLEKNKKHHTNSKKRFKKINAAIDLSPITGTKRYVLK